MTNHGGGGASWFRPCRHGYHRPPRFPKGSRRRRRRSPPAVAARPAPRAPSARIFDPRRDDGCPRATPRCAPPAGRMHAFIVSRTSRAPPTRFGRDQARVDTADGGRWRRHPDSSFLGRFVPCGPGCGADAITAGADLAAPRRCRHPGGIARPVLPRGSVCHGAVMLPGSALSRHCLLAGFVRGCPMRPLDGRMGPGGAGCATIACPQRRHCDFLPLCCAHSSRDKKVSSRRPPLRCGRERCGSIASRPEARHRGRMGRPGAGRRGLHLAGPADRRSGWRAGRARG